MKQEQNGSIIDVITQVTNVVGSTVSYRYGVDAGSRLTEGAMVLLIVKSTLAVANVTKLGYTYGTYTADLTVFASTTPVGMVAGGFNQKCVIGIQ
jgi:hypothetical protein